jgi:hypothetical protein
MRRCAGLVGLVVAGALMLPVHASAAPLFSTTNIVAAAGAPGSVASDDFNGDGRADLAVIDLDTNAVAILLGNGAGGFGGPTQFGAGDSPGTLTTGDFNGDGKVDLAVANNDSLSEYVSVLLGNGDGSFGAATNFPTGAALTSIATDDFNNDGRADLAVGELDHHRVAVLLGSGRGAFGPATTVATGINFPTALATEDLNADGNADLAVANEDNASSNVQVLLGTGSGGFGAATPFATGNNPQSLATGDFNHDGKPDLASANAGSDNVSVLLGTGTGGFGPTNNFGVDDAPGPMVSDDFNGDSRADLAVVSTTEPTSTNVRILLGTGHGGFDTGTPIRFGAGDTPMMAATDDFNRDGRPDLAVANQIGGDVSILLGTGSPSFAGPTLLEPSGANPKSVTTDDFNEDGFADLAVADPSSGVSILLGTGNGSFGDSNPFSAGTGPEDVVTGDFNFDGRADLAVANSGSADVSILLGTGSGGFAPAINTPVGGNPNALVTADFNHDGRFDLAVATAVDVVILLGTGDGNFDPPNHIAPGGDNVLTTDDFNDDGNADLAVGTGADVTILLGTGTGSFGAPTSFDPGITPTSVAADDFNQDGFADLAATTDSTVEILLGTGTGGFVVAGSIPTGGGNASVITGDFNADTREDLAVGRTDPGPGQQGVVLVLLGNGSGGFGAATDFLVGSGIASITRDDFNNDGRPDIATADLASGDLGILLGAGIPTAHLDRDALAFGRSAVGTPSASRVIRVSNGGNRELEITGAHLTGDDFEDFQIRADNCSGRTIEVSESCSISVRFDPLTEGLARAELEISDTAPHAPQAVRLRGFGDGSAPSVSITSGPAHGSTTSDSTPTYEFTSDDPNATFACKIGDGAFVPCTSPFTPAAPLADGQQTFRVRAVDEAGNTSEPAERTFTLSTVAPPPADDVIPPDAILAWARRTFPTKTRRARVKIPFTSTEPGATFVCSLDGAGFKPCSAPFTAKLRPGTHSFVVVAVDAAGNADPTPATARIKVTRAR